MASLFDQRAAERQTESTGESGETAATPKASDQAPGAYTPQGIKTAVQELLKHGLLEAERKPNLYRTALTQRAAIDTILEPLDLRLRLDEVRGLAFVTVAEELFGGEADEWSHALVRRQRLTLEQSLLVAILRQLYIAHEQEAGAGAGDAVVELEELLPQLQVYLGESGSEMKEQKRLRTLLEALRGHGIVSEVDEREQKVAIRPLITHLANPESLQNLLQHFRERAAQDQRGKR